MLAWLARTLVRLVFAPLLLVARFLRRPRGSYVLLRIDGPVAEVVPAPPLLARLFPRRPPLSLHRLRALSEAVARDPGRRGLVVELRSLGAGAATVDALLEALAPVRAGGKELVVHLVGPVGARELLVASAASRRYLTPPATVFLPGFGGSSLYFGAALSRLGIHFERFARREFKTAYETFEREGMSEGQRTQHEAILAGLADRLDAALVASGCPVSRAELEARGLLSAAEVVSLGVFAGAVFEDELPAALGIDSRKDRFVPAGAYLAHARFRLFPRFPRRRFVGVIPVRGVLGDGDGPLGVEGILHALRRLGRDPRVDAVVLHVDSPGGSAFASERLHHEVTSVRRHKPVVVSFGDVAASGGYFLAVAGASIHARPSSITGSIGVVAARPDASELVARFGLRREEVGAAPHGALFDPTTPLPTASREAFDRMIDVSYERFVSAVAEGRGRPAEEIEPLARGRVYLGRAAHGLGLLDGLGGFPEALEAARKLADARTGTRPRSLRVLDPRQTEPAEPLAAPAVALASTALGFVVASRPLWFSPEAAALAPCSVLPPGDTTGLSSPRGVFGMLAKRWLVGILAWTLVSCGGGASGGDVVHLTPGPAPDGQNFHGVWHSVEYGEMHLCQSNENVVGEYRLHERHGTVRGNATGDVLEFEWREERQWVPGQPQISEGHGYFRLYDAAADRRASAEAARRQTLAEDPEAQVPDVNIPAEWSLRGEWGHGDSNSGAGPWTARFQPRRSPDRCYDSIRRTAPTSGGEPEEIMLPESAATTSPRP